MDKDYDIVVAFQKIEEELINSMLGNIKRHTDWEKTEGFEWSMWQAEQLKALEKYRSTNINKFKGYFSTINEQIDEVLEKAYEKGNMQQEIEILSALREGYIFKKRKKKNITLNGKKADGTEKLNQGDDIKLFFSDETFEKFSGSGTPDSEFEALKVLSREFTSGKRKLPVVYEDKDVIFINKPTGCSSFSSGITKFFT